jgi:hypothetical protein
VHQDAVGHVRVGRRHLEVVDRTVVAPDVHPFDRRRLEPLLALDQDGHAPVEVREREEGPDAVADAGPSLDVQAAGIGDGAGQGHGLPVVPA